MNQTNETLQACISELEHEILSLRNDFIDRDHDITDTERKLKIVEYSVPIKEVCKIRDSGARGGQLSWPHYTWELIIKQLINGTPPSSINANIVSLLTAVSHSTKIKELPSIWTIRRAWKVLLVIAQVLPSYCIAKVDKWEQLFTNRTSRFQDAF